MSAITGTKAASSTLFSYKLNEKAHNFSYESYYEKRDLVFFSSNDF